jgi:hypothetical protein
VTKPAATEENRRIREAGTAGEWSYVEIGDRVESAEGNYICSSMTNETDDVLIAHAVNQLVPLSEERDKWKQLAEQWQYDHEQLDHAHNERCGEIERLRRFLQKAEELDYAREIQDALDFGEKLKESER